MRALGRTSLSISPLVFGTNTFGWAVDEKSAFYLLDRFFDSGFNAIDTADCYCGFIPGLQGGEAETIIGKWLKHSGPSRDSALIITKVGATSQGNPREKGLAVTRIIKGIEGSLRRLQTDYVDLYLSHFPDSQTSHEETLRALQTLKEQGKIRAIGCSNFSVDELKGVSGRR